MKSVGLLVSAMLFLCSTVYAERTVWYVHPDSALNTIQAGLDSCANNDMVLVGPGTYIENIVWPHTWGIHLISELGPEYTTIDGDSAGTVIDMSWHSPWNDSVTVIRGFTIRKGSSSGHGGGIHLGGGLTIYRLSIVDNIILNNSAAGSGGGIHCGGYAFCLISGNTITENSATSGGGIHIGGFLMYAEISNNIITHNTSSEFAGGGIMVHWYCHTDILHNTIANNSSTRGGGLSVTEAGGNVCHNTITCNSASLEGGAIYFGGSWGDIRSNTITHNTASIHGGGISCHSCATDPSPPVIAGNTITDNTGSLGGGISCRSESPVFIDSNTISSNMGAGIWCDSNSTLQINSNNIVSNIGFGVLNLDSAVIVIAENNWWGDSTGPYHADSNPGGLGDTVSDYVDFDPWLTDSVEWVGIEEQPIVKPVDKQANLGATIFSGPLLLPEDRKCKVFDITGRVVIPDKIRPGIYFIEIDGVVTQKVVKVR